MDTSNKPHFYNKFINEENLKNINEGKIQKQFFNKTFLFYILSISAARSAVRCRQTSSAAGK